MRKLRFMPAVLLAAAVLGLAPKLADAQVMADKVPGDTVIYAEWAGSDALGQAYDASHLKAFLNTLKLPQFVADLVDSEMKKENDPAKIEDAKLLAAWMTAMAKSPTAFYMGSWDFTNIARPVPHLALFSKVGKQTATDLAEKLNALVNRDADPNVPVHGVHAAGDYLVLYMGDTTLEDRLQKPADADNLAARAGFQKAMGLVGGNKPATAAWVYMDFEGGFKLIDEAVKAAPDPQVQAMVPIIMDGLGLNSLKQLAWAGSFDGPNWRSELFVGMGEKRTGLLSFFEHPPITDAAYKMIPAGVTMAGVARFDGSQLLTDAQDMAKKINERAPQQLDLIFQQIYAISGIDVKNDLLPSFGDEFVYYGAPAAAGNSMRGLTVINKLKDPQKAETAMTAIENMVNLTILQQDPNSKAQFHTDSLPAPYDKVTAHIMALEKVTPAWAIYDGSFYFSLSLAGLQSAIEQVHSDGTKSILTDPQFVAMQKKIGEDKVSAFQYYDLAAGAPEVYELASQMLAAGLRAGGPDYSLPPLEKITPDMGPLLSSMWSDKDGLHMRDAGPFPMGYFFTPLQFTILRFDQNMLMRNQPMGGPPAPAGRGAPAGLP